MTDWSVIVNVGGKEGFSHGREQRCREDFARRRRVVLPHERGVSSVLRPVCVIASEAKQIHFAARRKNGLLRRYAPSANASRLSQAMTAGYSFAFSRYGAPEVRIDSIPPLKKRRSREWLYGLCRVLPGDEFVLSPSLADQG